LTRHRRAATRGHGPSSSFQTAIGATCSARPGCAFSQARIYSRYIVLQIDAIEEWVAGEAH
jgi:hypothetical protein